MATGTRISIQVEYQQAQKVLEDVGLAFDEPELLQAIGLAGVRWMVQNLAVAGLDGSHEEMSPNTVAANPTRTSSHHFSSRYRSRLAQSFVSNVSGNAVEIGTEDEFAIYHQYGTNGPYPIRPINAHALRFMTAAGVRFAKLVMHPGIPARPLLPLDETARDLAVRTIEAATARALQAAR